MNIQTIEARLKRIDRQRERLSRQLEARREAQFNALPARVGLRTIDQLMEALSPYAKSRRGNGKARVRRASTRTNGKTAAAKGAGRVRRRRTYTAQQKAAVKAALGKGEKTVGQISKETGVSPFSIKDWKEEWGMTRKRKKAAKKK